MKRLLALVAILIVISALVWMSTRPATTAPNGDLAVATSFYPLYYFASEIGGKHATVTNIVPAGSEPHEYEPTPRDIAAIEAADVVLLNGEGFESWGDRIAGSVTGTVLRLAEGMATLEGEHGHDEEEGAQHAEGEHDPHVWLSPALSRVMATRIADAFVAADPAHADDYRANATALDAKLATLDDAYRRGLAQCARRDIVTSHAAFGYIARDYDLQQIAIAGLSPEEEPSVQTLAAVAAEAKKRGATHIFFETLVPPDFSQTIAREIGAQTLALNPLEGLTDEEMSAGKNYVTEMQQNLKNLQLALACTE